MTKQTNETNWTKELSIWETLFELKEDDSVFGVQGTLFFATDYAKDVSTGEFKTVIAYTSFNGMNLGKGICSYIVTKDILENKFAPIGKTFREYEQERQEEYFAELRKENTEDALSTTGILDANGENIKINDKWEFQGEHFTLQIVKGEYWFIPEKDTHSEMEWIDPIISTQGILVKEDIPTGEL